jgi:hypothetical protein
MLAHQKKKAKIDKKTRHKIYDDENRARTFFILWSRKVNFESLLSLGKLE